MQCAVYTMKISSDRTALIKSQRSSFQMRISMSVTYTLAASCAAVLLSACNAGSSATPISNAPSGVGQSQTHSVHRTIGPDVVTQYAYVTNATNNNITGFSINAGTGNLTQLTGSPWPAHNEPGALAVSPSGFLYVANISSNDISAYTISPTNGALTQLTGSPFATGCTSPGNPESVAADPVHPYLYVACFQGGVAAFSIATNGALTAVTGSPFTAGFAPFGVAVDPAGKYAYVTNYGGSNVSGFNIATNGALSQISGSPWATATTPGPVAVTPNDQFAYVTALGTGCCTGGDISGYSIATNGALTQLPGSPWASTGAMGIVIAHAGKRAYVTNYYGTGLGDLHAWRIHTNGKLTSNVAGQPYAGETEPIGVAATQSSKFVYTANFTSSTDAVSGYKSAATGALTPLVASPFTAGTGSYGVAICRKSGAICIPPTL
jgi:6-phosphogluconolactonase (cycloisomerase 2 family)